MSWIPMLEFGRVLNALRKPISAEGPGVYFRYTPAQKTPYQDVVLG